MSTEYPEVTTATADESGIVPAQNANNKPPEWPKKLRTLTAAELDRLTIDNSGRFYWDGKLVNYDTGKKDSKISESLNRSLDILEQAANDLGPNKTPPRIEGAELPKPGEPGHKPIDLDLAKLEEAVTQPESSIALPLPAGDSIRVTLTRWQKVGLVVAVIGIAIGAFGVASYAFVAAHEWGCRTGVFQSSCMPGTRSRSDIPA